MLRRAFVPMIALSMAIFVAAPLLIERAPYETTMGLVQKIFYFHVPSAMMLFLSAFVCGIASAAYLFRRSRTADHVAVAAAELVALFGVIVLVTGPLWARVAWGVWWQCEARLTSTLVLWLIFLAYLLLRRYGGHKAAAGVSLDPANLGALTEAFDAAYAEQLGEEAGRAPIDEHDGERSLGDLDLDLISAIESLGPYRIGFPAPRYLCVAAEVVTVRVIKKISTERQMLKKFQLKVLDLGFLL